MFTSLQNPLSLAGRALLALLFVPAGFGKIAGFAGAAGYAASKGVPFPEIADHLEHRRERRPAA